jgi:AcrR family transcriptional regulator
LRQDQVEQTRERILEGLVRTLARGAAALSIPAVAREAGVSIPTVYRYFRSKQELLEGLGGHIVRHLRLDVTTPPHNPAEFLAIVRQLYEVSVDLNAAWRAAAMSGAWREIRPETLPVRRRLIERALVPVTMEMSEADRDRLRDVILLLASSAAIRAFDDYLGLKGKDAADVAVWAIETLIAGALARNAEGSAGHGPNETSG